MAPTARGEKKARPGMTAPSPVTGDICSCAVITNTNCLSAGSIFSYYHKQTLATVRIRKMNRWQLQKAVRSERQANLAVEGGHTRSTAGSEGEMGSSW